MLQLFMKGGPIMWPLLATSLVALTMVIERLIAYYREKKRRNPSDVRAVIRFVREDKVSQAIETGALSTDAIARVLATALQAPMADFAKAYEHQAARDLHRSSRGIIVLDTIITIAPLLGLLGTVTGMIHAFGLMGASELEAPAAITGGIAEALIATAFGLGIAILALIPYNWLNSRIEQAHHDYQDAGTQVELHLSQKLAKQTPMRAAMERHTPVLTHS